MKKYIVHLSAEEQTELVSLTRKGKASARRIKRALVLLAANEGDQDKRIVERARVSLRTVEGLRRRFV